ncbi:hypothetical protein WJX74_004223 [Apatococcus lobatus]|uniref:Elongator complex protein 6 n=1 Tax=Apatococcus lobatus TaxID=904363 RepID=A0AAW1RSG6_9CHLO
MDSFRVELVGNILIKDVLEVESSFLLLYLVKQAIRAGQKVVLGLCTETQQQIKLSLRKLGINLQACIEKQQVTVVEAVNAHSAANTGQLQEWHKQLGAAVKQLTGQAEPVILAFDDISTASCLARSDQEWHAFLYYLCGLSLSLKQVCCLMPVHMDIQEDHEWIARLEHSCETILELEPLDTGPSIELTGRLHETRSSFQAHARLHRDRAPLEAGSLGVKTTALEYSYKLLEGGVRFSQV